MEKWGIWGLGVVGKSVIRYLSSSGCQLSVFDDRSLNQEELNFLKTHQVTIFPPSSKGRFLQDSHFIVPSPGVDASNIPSAKRRGELDLFNQSWKKPLIAVTGSLGKTTLVTALTEILTAHSLTISTGGNIGTPMLDLVSEQAGISYGLLELSSFQLEYARLCAPDLAIWTTFHPNHLDRHKTIDEYFMAKYRILEFQNVSQKALVPFSLNSQLRALTKRPLVFFSADNISKSMVAALNEQDVLYTLDQQTLVKTSKTEDNKTFSTRISISQKNNPLHTETWLCALAALDILGLTENNQLIIPELSAVPHRLEFVGTYNDILLYNDSKATIIESTIAAVSKLSAQPIHLILGGLSKGVDRSKNLSMLKNSVKSVACFGKEAQQLHTLCKSLAIASTVHENLPDAFIACVKIAQAQETILLSPGGSSYDLYKNYEERGNHFKFLIKELTQKSASL